MLRGKTWILTFSRGGTKPLFTPLKKDIRWPVQTARGTPKAALSTCESENLLGNQFQCLNLSMRSQGTSRVTFTCLYNQVHNLWIRTVYAVGRFQLNLPAKQWEWGRGGACVLICGHEMRKRQLKINLLTNIQKKRRFFYFIKPSASSQRPCPSLETR